MSSATETLRLAALAWMKAQVGKRETGENCIFVWDEVYPPFQCNKNHENGGSWCLAGFIDAWLHVGVDIRGLFSLPYLVPQVFIEAKRMGLVKQSNNNPGDGIFLIPEQNGPVHFGMSDPGPDPLFWGVEANTSAPDGGRDGFFRKGRPRSLIAGWLDMDKLITEHPEVLMSFTKEDARVNWTADVVPTPLDSNGKPINPDNTSWAPVTYLRIILRNGQTAIAQNAAMVTALNALADALKNAGGSVDMEALKAAMDESVKTAVEESLTDLRIVSGDGS